MGVVYRGFDPVIGRTVALKTLVIDTGDAQAKEFRDRLYREAAAAGALSHPNIVTIFDIIEDGAITAVAMEFIEGRSLAAIIAERAPLPLDVAIEILGQVCSALDYAASQGIVHRDIKPANILMTAAGRAKVTDFGVARLALSTMTQAGTVLGSPSYMSPEQVRGLPLDGRSDLFSAAVVFFEMITRERPFAGNDIATTMYRIAHEPPTPPSQFNASIGPDVSAVLDRAFAKDPAGRFETGADFVAELRRITSLGSAREVSPALSAMAASPLPSVPLVVMPSMTASNAVPRPPSVPAPAVLPVPATWPTFPAPAAQGRPVLAPIPGHGVPQGLPPVSGSDSGPALPVIPSLVSAPPPVMSPTPTVRPAASAGGRKTVAMVGAGGALLMVLAIVAVVFLRGGSQMANQNPPDPGAVKGAGTSSTPPAPPDSVPPAVASIPTPAAPAQGSAGVSAGARAPGQQPAPGATAARPRAVPRPPTSAPGADAAVARSLPDRPAATAGPAGRVYISTEVDERPQVVRQVPPVYPEGAIALRVQDVVVLTVLVGPTGRPEDIQVLRGSQKASALDAAAVTAVRQWEFSPAKKNGQPVPCWFNVGVPFQRPK
jgi:serine/threonine-protein kinase